MYIGRFVVVGPDIGAYRVSSRSFPNRKVVRRGDDTLTVVPTADAEATDNPYVSYNCARAAGDGTVIGNGSHVDPIAEKYDRGYPARDALVEALHAMDYEKDDYDTPRVAGIVEDDAGYVGIVRHDALLVREVDEPHLVATYEENEPRPFEFEPHTAVAAARTAYGLDYEHVVCAAGAHVGEESQSFAVYNGDSESE
jgi:IMP cyclohydrolase